MSVTSRTANQAGKSDFRRMASVGQMYDLFVTCVDKIGPLLKIWGQVDRQTSLYIEKVLLEMLPQFDKQNNVQVVVNNLQVGLMCCAKYKDGIYYRAQVRNIHTQAPGMVEVRFIDYGNVDLIQVENVRLFDENTLKLSTIPPQASEFILGNIMNGSNEWDDTSLSYIHQEIAYTELTAIVLHTVGNIRVIRIYYKENDFAFYLVKKGFGDIVQLEIQEMFIRNLAGVPSTSLLQSPILQKIPYRPPVMVQKPELLLTYKTATLQPESEHMVYVSYVEDGPFLFSIQLQSMEETLEKLMSEINHVQLEPLREPPLPGHPCLARCLEDNTICRAVVLSLVGDKCKTYYVDFGNTDILPFSNIYQIPLWHIQPKVMSMRFTLSDLKNLNVTTEMKCAFKDYVTNKLLRLRVKIEDSPLIQYCELYDNDKNIADVLYDKPHEYRSLALNKGQKNNVIVSYIEGCKKFFVQLKECAESLNSLMLALAATSDNAPNLEQTDIQIGRSCCAFYSGDSQWYRAKILVISPPNVTVKYVDYGNEETVPETSLKKIDTKFVDIIPAQAIECCLYGYQNMSFNSEIENVFESLTLECEFTMKVKGKHNDILLVDLFDNVGNNVAALLIEKLAAQKMQMTSLPAQQIAAALMNDTGSGNNDDKILVRNDQAQGENNNKTVWRSNSQEKSWRGEERKGSGSWRTGAVMSPTEDKTNRYQKDSVNNRLSINQNVDNRKTSRKKRREKNQWNDDPGARGDSWDNKPARRQQDGGRPRSRGENWNDDGKKTFNRGSSGPRENSWGEDRKTFQRNNRDNSRDEGKRSFKRDNSWGDDSQRQRSGSSSSDRKGWNKRDDAWGDDKRPYQKRQDSFDSQSSGNRPYNKPRFDDTQGKSFKNKKDFSSSQPEVEPSPPQPLADFSEPFKYQELEFGPGYGVTISWFYNPQSFFVQNMTQQQEFRDMMVQIQDAYPKRKPIADPVPVGASVIAEFSEDSVLYRATVLESKGSKYKVQYVDFGNVGAVDSSKIFQVECRFMELPMQSIRCGLGNIKPIEDTWPISENIDKLFNRDNFVCVFENYVDDMYIVQLWDKDVDVRHLLIENGIATDASIFEMDGDPVDVGILVGQQLRVVVSHIESLDKFYVQLDKEKMSQIETVISTITENPTTLQVIAADQIVPQLNCLVKSDDKYYRSIVTDNQNTESIIVNCPDTGRQITVNPSEIYIMPSTLCVYWYQSIECVLHNLNSDSCRLISDEDFKNNEGKEFIVYVDDVENGRIVCTLYDLEGVKIELFIPDEGAYLNVEKICPLPILSSNLTVYITHVNNGDSLFVQDVKDTNKIAELLEKLFEHCENDSAVIEPTVSNLCCAKSEDGNWYRGRISEVTDEGVRVVYIDYGNSETVPKESLRNLDERFYIPNELALNVGLGLVETAPELKDTLIGLTQDKEVRAVVYYGGEGWIVDLFDGEDSIVKVLVDSELGKFTSEANEVVLETIPEVDDSGKRAEIRISHCDSPGEFYVQLTSSKAEIDKLQAELKEKIDSLPDLEGVDIGSLCAAKYSINEKWFRAEVLDADADITTVRFVDFGNTDVIDNSANNIKQLTSELLSVDKYARKCSLNMKPVRGDEWSPEACEVFENAILCKAVYSEIVYQDEKNKSYVNLFDPEGRNIGEALIETGFAEWITRDIKDDIASKTGFVSHLNSISEFWIQLESSVPDLEMIVERLTEVETFPDLQDLSPGILCAALYPDDDMWYRARILSNTVAGIEVLFIDYGNSSTALKLKVLPEDLAHMPPLAQKCCLNKSTEWLETATEKFREISEDGATVFTVKKLAPGETHTVELFIDGENIAEQLNSPLRPIAAMRLIKGYIDSFTSSDDFYFVEYSETDGTSYKCRLETPLDFTCNESLKKMNEIGVKEYEIEYLTEEVPRTVRLYYEKINIVDVLSLIPKTEPNTSENVTDVSALESTTEDINILETFTEGIVGAVSQTENVDTPEISTEDIVGAVSKNEYVDTPEVSTKDTSSSVSKTEKVNAPEISTENVIAPESTTENVTELIVTPESTKNITEHVDVSEIASVDVCTAEAIRNESASMNGVSDESVSDDVAPVKKQTVTENVETEAQRSTDEVLITCDNIRSHFAGQQEGAQSSPQAIQSARQSLDKTEMNSMTSEEITELCEQILKKLQEHRNESNIVDAPMETPLMNVGTNLGKIVKIDETFFSSNTEIKINTEGIIENIETPIPDGCSDDSKFIRASAEILKVNEAASEFLKIIQTNSKDLELGIVESGAEINVENFECAELGICDDQETEIVEEKSETRETRTKNSESIEDWDAQIVSEIISEIRLSTEDDQNKTELWKSAPILVAAEETVPIIEFSYGQKLKALPVIDINDPESIGNWDTRIVSEIISENIDLEAQESEMVLETTLETQKCDTTPPKTESLLHSVATESSNDSKTTTNATDMSVSASSNDVKDIPIISPLTSAKHDYQTVFYMNIASKSPFEDKIVPGSVSRGDLEKVDPSEPFMVPVLLKEEKIVPGSISRGDLEVSEVFQRALREEKLASSSFNQGDISESTDEDDIVATELAKIETRIGEIVIQLEEALSVPRFNNLLDLITTQILDIQMESSAPSTESKFTKCYNTLKHLMALQSNLSDDDRKYLYSKIPDMDDAIKLIDYIDDIQKYGLSTAMIRFYDRNVELHPDGSASGTLTEISALDLDESSKVIEIDNVAGSNGTILSEHLLEHIKMSEINNILGPISSSKFLNDIEKPIGSIKQSGIFTETARNTEAEDQEAFEKCYEDIDDTKDLVATECPYESTIERISLESSEISHGDEFDEEESSSDENSTIDPMVQQLLEKSFTLAEDCCESELQESIRNVEALGSLEIDEKLIEETQKVLESIEEVTDSIEVLPNTSSFRDLKIPEESIKTDVSKTSGIYDYSSFTCLSEIPAGDVEKLAEISFTIQPDDFNDFALPSARISEYSHETLQGLKATVSDDLKNYSTFISLSEATYDGSEPRKSEESVDYGSKVSDNSEESLNNVECIHQLALTIDNDFFQNDICLNEKISSSIEVKKTENTTDFIQEKLKDPSEKVVTIFSSDIDSELEQTFWVETDEASSKIDTLQIHISPVTQFGDLPELSRHSFESFHTAQDVNVERSELSFHSALSTTVEENVATSSDDDGTTSVEGINDTPNTEQ